jgi:hypothetical protein
VKNSLIYVIRDEKVLSFAYFTGRPIARRSPSTFTCGCKEKEKEKEKEKRREEKRKMNALEKIKNARKVAERKYIKKIRKEHRI